MFSWLFLITYSTLSWLQRSMLVAVASTLAFVMLHITTMRELVITAKIYISTSRRMSVYQNPSLALWQNDQTVS